MYGTTLSLASFLQTHTYINIIIIIIVMEVSLPVHQAGFTGMHLCPNPVVPEAQDTQATTSCKHRHHTPQHTSCTAHQPHVLTAMQTVQLQADRPTHATPCGAHRQAWTHVLSCCRSSSSHNSTAPYLTSSIRKCSDDITHWNVPTCLVHTAG